MAIQLFVPTFDVEECVAEIRDSLEKGWPGMGDKTLKFEEKWKEYTGHENAYYLNSATAGLNLAFDILKEQNGWQDGDEVISTPLTFISTNHAIALAGLHAVFADVDEYLCLDPVAVEKAITVGDARKRCDAVVYDERLTPLMIIECKAETVPLTQKTLDQAITYNRKLNVPYLLLSNGVQSIFVHGTDSYTTGLPRYTDLLRGE